LASQRLLTTSCGFGVRVGRGTWGCREGEAWLWRAGLNRGLLMGQGGAGICFTGVGTNSGWEFAWQKIFPKGFIRGCGFSVMGLSGFRGPVVFFGFHSTFPSGAKQNASEEPGSRFFTGGTGGLLAWKVGGGGGIPGMRISQGQLQLAHQAGKSWAFWGLWAGILVRGGWETVGENNPAKKHFLLLGLRGLELFLGGQMGWGAAGNYAG